MSWYTLAWGAWLAIFAVIETKALLDKRVTDGTLSEHVWAWLGKGWTWKRIVLLAGMAVLTGHLTFGVP